MSRRPCHGLTSLPALRSFLPISGHNQDGSQAGPRTFELLVFLLQKNTWVSFSFTCLMCCFNEVFVIILLRIAGLLLGFYYSS